MFPGIAMAPFQSSGQLKQACDVIILFYHFGQFGLFHQCFFQRHFQIIRDQLGNGIDLGQFHVQHPADVANHRLGLHRTECNDLGYFILTVFVGDVADCFFTTAHTEVDIKIRHGNAFRIQEAFKQ